VKVVLDTNVIFSAFATHGLAHAVFELCLQHHEIVVSRPILKELEVHFTGKLKMPSEKSREILAFLNEFCLVGKPAALKKSACRDRSDDHVLGLALAARADCIVSGDQDLLVMKKIQKTPILNPRQFWEKLRAQPLGD
jgi:putative PIN family toxin of toxin-antitoxin system